MSFYEIRFGVPFDGYDFKECLRIAFCEVDSDERLWTSDEDEYAFNKRPRPVNEFLTTPKYSLPTYREKVKSAKLKERNENRENALIFLLHGGSIDDCHKRFGIPKKVIEAWLE